MIKQDPLLEQQHQSREPDSLSRNTNSHQFNNSFEYYISIIGISVGYGSFWRFPYVMYENGGGAFLVPYTISFLVLGIPMLYLQLTIGHMHQLSLPFIFEKMQKGLKWVGLAISFVMFNICGFYNILLTYSYRYLLTAFEFPLPYANESSTQTSYFSSTVLNKSNSIAQFGEIQWLLFSIFLISLVIVYYIVKNGVKISGKIAAYTAITPYLFFIILLLRGLMLPGGYQGILICLTPNFNKLLDPSAWIAAFVQVFFQLCLGCGVLINMTSMKPKHQSNLKGLFIIPICVYLCSILCAACVYIYINYQATIQGISFYDMKLSGLELSFNVFPKALSTLPFPNLWVFLFYIGMVCLGIDSLFGGIQAIVCYISDQIKFNNLELRIFSRKLQLLDYKKILLICFGLQGFLYASSSGIYYLQFVNKFLLTAPLAISAFIEYVFFVKICSVRALAKEEQACTGERVPSWILSVLESRLMLAFLAFNLVLSLLTELLYFRQFPAWFCCCGLFLGLFLYVWGYLYWRKNRNLPWKLSFEVCENYEMKQLKI